MDKQRKAQAIGRANFDIGVLMQKWLALFSRLGIRAKAEGTKDCSMIQ
jgi:hypothetical protein